MRGRATLPHKHEVRYRQSKLFLIDRERVSNDGKLQDLAGKVGPCADTHELFAGTYRINEFGDRPRA